MKRSTWRCALLALSCLSGGLGCAVSGSSFETVGVPRVDVGSGEGAVVIGWAREERGGWAVQKIRVDGQRSASGWDRETQRPSVVKLAPGDRELQLYVAREGEGRSAPRRLKLRPLRFALAEGQVRLCAIEIEPRRGVPQASCAHYIGSRDERHERRGEAADSVVSEQRTEAPVEPSGEVDAGEDASRPDMVEVLRRLERIEARLEELALPSPPADRAPPPFARSRLQIDTDYPEAPRRAAQPVPRSPYGRFDRREGSAPATR